MTQQQKHQQAIEILQQTLIIAQELKDQKSEANVMVWLEFNYKALEEKQTQNLRSLEAKRLLEQGIKLTQQQKHQQAIEILQQTLIIAQELKDQKSEANVMVWLGFNYKALEEKLKAQERILQPTLESIPCCERSHW